jgi:hypothetical protein
MMIQERLQNLISLTENTCIPWIRKNTKGQMEFVDPIDKVEISAHYGATHMSVALLLNGHEQLGNALLDSVLERWESSAKLPGFHNDFNLFALCVIAEHGSDEQKEKIRKIVLQTADSNHDTVNWLPMRWGVNRTRFNWTKDEKYRAACEECRAKIAKATWSDGFIDDRLPTGLSFNLQYDVATVAVMQYLRIQGEEVAINKEIGALLAAEAPDGDINYLGRGTNQIFAWGLWVYLLATAGQIEPLERAISFLEKSLPTALKNNNLMLNDIPGEEKYMWWDYHYCSVYTAHLLMWLILARRDMGKGIVKPEEYRQGNSGVEIYRSDKVFVVLFRGRREYLAEKGPVLCALWSKKLGMILKGAFGPWQGAFGNEHMVYGVTLRNYAGILRVVPNKDFTRNRLIKKLNPCFKLKDSERTIPNFCHIDVQVVNDGVKITYKMTKSENIIFNMAVTASIEELSELIFLTIDGERCKLQKKIMILNQYGWFGVFESVAKYATYAELFVQG